MVGSVETAGQLPRRGVVGQVGVRVLPAHGSPPYFPADSSSYSATKTTLHLSPIVLLKRHPRRRFNFLERRIQQIFIKISCLQNKMILVEQET
jgi:hypothetical protein